MMVIRAYGYEIWENIRKYLNKRFEETGYKSAYFPMFIPESYLKKGEYVESLLNKIHNNMFERVKKSQ